jgi:hypothetical protein
MMKSRSSRHDAAMPWEFCETCGQAFTGVMELGLVSERWRQAQSRPETHACLQPQTWEKLSTVGRGDGAAAEVFLREAVAAVATRTLGTDDINTLDASRALATALSGQGKLAEAEPIYRRCHAVSARMLGPDHERTLSFAAGLAAGLSCQGRHEESLALFRLTLVAFKRKCGPESTLTLTSAMQTGTVRGIPFLFDAHSFVCVRAVERRLRAHPWELMCQLSAQHPIVECDICILSGGTA